MNLAGLIIISALALIIYISFWYVFGRRLQRLDVADTAWGGGFVVVASAAFTANPNNLTMLILGLVLIWAFRLAFHIWRRNSLKGPDPRYDTLSAKWPKESFWLRAYFSIFLFQALLLLIVSLPISVIGSQTDNQIGALTMLGVAIWIAGYVIESVADAQLKQFISEPNNKGKIMDRGLWKYSRHPNYFGELMMWWAIALIGMGGSLGWIGLLGPMLLTHLIINVSGIAMIEKRYDDNPDYQNYKQRTSALISLPPRR